MNARAVSLAPVRLRVRRRPPSTIRLSSTRTRWSTPRMRARTCVMYVVSTHRPRTSARPATTMNARHVSRAPAPWRVRRPRLRPRLTTRLSTTRTAWWRSPTRVLRACVMYVVSSRVPPSCARLATMMNARHVSPALPRVVRKACPGDMHPHSLSLSLLEPDRVMVVGSGQSEVE